MPKTLNHVHTYVRQQTVNRKPVIRDNELMFKCNHPDCSHYAPYSLVIGKRSICAVCHEHELILTNRDLERVKPRCHMCSNTKDARNMRKAHDVAANLLKGLAEVG